MIFYCNDCTSDSNEGIFLNFPIFKCSKCLFSWKKATNNYAEENTWHKMRQGSAQKQAITKRKERKSQSKMSDKQNQDLDDWLKRFLWEYLCLTAIIED